MELIQKSFLSKNIYSIENAVLRITQKGVFENKEFTIPLDEISPNIERHYFRQHIIIPLIILLVFMYIGVSMNILEVSFPVLFLSFIILWLLYTKAYGVIRLNTKRELLMINAQSPSRKAVDEFITTLFQKQKDYLKWKYGTLDKDLDFDIQITNFRKLRNMGILSDAEYEQLKMELKAIIKGEKE
jgi:hypothetical protein